MELVLKVQSPASIIRETGELVSNKFSGSPQTTWIRNLGGEAQQCYFNKLLQVFLMHIEV